MTDTNAYKQAVSQVESICEMVAALECDYDRLDELTQAAGDYSDADEAREAIQEDPLSVEVRSAWASVGDSLTPEEFRVVLCTGGPHVELVGDLDENNEPSRVRVLYRDWGDSGEYYPSASEREALMTYLSCLYFGE